ncbi:MAG: hypothetical protein AAGD14_00295 [Planctomycetota bacterium]
MSDERVQTLQAVRIIAIAITTVPAIFLGACLFLINQPDTTLGQSETGSLISYVALATALMSFGLYPLIPKVIRFREENTLVSFRIVVIMRLASAEFPALLGCVAYLMEGKTTVVGAGVALAMVIFMGSMFPSESRLEAWEHE